VVEATFLRSRARKYHTFPNFTEDDPPPGTDPARAAHAKLIREAARNMSKSDWLTFVAHLHQHALTQDVASSLNEGIANEDSADA
jgi:hypothetical protein